MGCILRFLRDESGASMVEYGLIVSALAAGIITVLNSLSQRFNDAFNLLINALRESIGV